MNLDKEWLIGQARDKFTAGKIIEIISWREEMLTSNYFPQGEDSFKLYLGDLILCFTPFSAVASLEVYQEIFKNNNHRLHLSFSGNNDKVIFDIGANQGFYALMLKMVNPSCHIYCFEPNPLEYNTLLLNIRLNGVSGISTIPKAVGNSNRIIDFEYLPNVGSISGLGVRMVQRQWLKEEFVSSLRVEQITLDSFCKNVDLKQIDILKIDVEGSEVNVLAGAKNTIKKSSKVVIERHSMSLRKDIIQTMKKSGFELVHDEDEHCLRYYGDLYFIERRNNEGFSQRT